MTESGFRLVLGIWLVLALWLPLPPAIYVLMMILVVEAATNWRVPALVSRLRGMPPTPPCADGACCISFEAERALRLLLVSVLGVALFVVPGPLWWLPWFMGFALIGAGLSGVCPMVEALRMMGMR